VLRGLAARVRSLASPFLTGGGEAQAIQRNVGWLSADRVFRLAVGTVLNVWTINYLGPHGFGRFSFAQSVVGILAILSQLGLDTILVRELVRHPERSSDNLGSTLALRQVGAFVVLVASAATMALLRPADRTMLTLAAIFAGSYSFIAFDVIESWFQSRTRVAPYVVAKSVAFVVASAAKAWALAARAPVEMIAVTIAGEYLLAAAALVVAYRVEPAAPRGWRARTSNARGLLRDAWPLMLNNMVFMLASRLDQVMLTLIRGERENGIYAVAPRLTEVLFFIPITIHNMTAPALLRSHGRDPAEYERRLLRVFRVLNWMAIGIALAISVSSPWVIRLLFPEFSGSAAVWALHIWSAPAFFMAVATTNWFVAENRQRDLLARGVISLTTNLLLNLWLIPAFGARGAALATLLSQTAAYWGANALFPSTRWLFRLQCRSLFPGARRSA
jgi:PST family polysaccharide transporter